MLEEKITSYFNQYPKLRVLFFFDKDEEYLEEVRALDLEGIEIEYWNNNPFSLKWKLVNEFKDNRVFLYLPMATPSSQEDYHAFPLMGLLMANKELQLDNVGEFMVSFGLQRHHKGILAKYIQELKYSGVQEVCKPILNAANFNESELQKGLLSSFLKFKTITSWPLLIAKLLTLSGKEDETDLNRVITKVTSLTFVDLICKQIRDITGYPIQDLKREGLLEVGKSILYNKLTQTLPGADGADPYKDLKVSDPSQLTHLNQMLFEVERQPTVVKSFDSFLQKMEGFIKGEKLIEIYGVDANFAEFNSAMIWEVVKQLQDHLLDTSAEVIKKLEGLSLQQDLDINIINTLKYLVYAGKMFYRIKDIKTYVLDTPEAYVLYYAEEGYKIDSQYRKAVSLFKQLDITEIPSTVELDNIHAQLNSLYEKHTDNLNREWLACLNQFGFDYPKLNVPKQYDFYDTEIAGLDQKVVVIISDALRYEVAQELLSELHGDAKNTADIRYMLASIPSKTNIGMSQLLPRKEVVFNKGDIKIDGKSSTGTQNRSKILQSFNEESQAVKFADLEGLNRPEKREIFKRPVVYLYHDVIDATGDKKSSERRTFEVVKNAIDELKLLVKNLHAAMNVAKVLITADHGFLYNDREIKEREKETLPEQHAFQSHNRYYLTEQETKPELGYCVPLGATTVFNEELFVTIPLAVNRYKKQGVGHQFVHGGGSLQELVVPLIESSRKRLEVTKKVMPLLVYKGNLKVVSNILRLNILQENEVSRMEKERSITIGLYKENELVSNLEELLLNSTSESPSERISKVDLVLAKEAADVNWLKLKIFDQEDALNPLVEERVQNITVIPTDF